MSFIPRTISPQFDSLPLADDEKALLRGCLECPWDDARFLVYADWVEEHDQPERAAYLRASVQTEEIKKTTLIPDSILDWLEPFVPNRKDWLFFRGLPSHYKINYPKEVDFSSNDGKWNRFPWDWCFSYRTTNNIMPETVRRMVRSPRMLNLTRFEFPTRLESLQREEFAEGTYFNNVTRLDLSQNRIPTKDMESILGNPTLINLSHLSLERCRLDPDAAGLLANTQKLNGLKLLNLNATGLESQGVIHIATSPYLGRLQELMLHGATIDDEAAAALTESQNLTDLKTLNLAHTDLTEEAIVLIASCSQFSNLISLNLSQQLLTNKALIAIANNPHLSNLRFLSVESWSSGDLEQGTIALANSPFLKKLKKLDINRRTAGKKGMEAIFQAKLKRRSKYDPK